ncbi:indole-3-glycerol phosphate synthase TrpC [Rapidithrix thailandica]|uniref:Indole-3-glycerol phosphate synthase n=1 Tax=Rapidithrix thailandica TaxID=413964 RepID=A0AAW9SBV2_9BACT
MNILDKIILHKREEVALQKEKVSTNILESFPLFDRKPLSTKGSIRHPERSGIIAEFKRKSPSKGIINDRVLPQDITKAYQAAGASAVSVLTDQAFFAGSLDDLTAARQALQIPVLRKDFVIDEYQILEAKAYGADLILLIAANLEPQQTKQLAAFAKSLELEVLMEVHNREELELHTNEHLDIIGVNNRNLKTFEVSLDTSIELSELIPKDFVKISESGISEIENIVKLKDYGFEGFLIGENFMKQDNPGQACQDFIQALKSAQTNE